MQNLKWNAKQIQFLNAIKPYGEQRYNKVFLHGAMRSGKSYVLTHAVDLICRSTPGITFLYMRKTFESLRDNNIDICKKNPGMLQAAYGKWANQGKDFNYFNGSTIKFRYAENPEGIVGMTVGGIAIDQIEAIQQEDYKMIESRLTQFGDNSSGAREYNTKFKEQLEKKLVAPPKNYIFLSANPKSCWLKDEFINKEDPEWLKIHLSIMDNWDNIGDDVKAYIEKQSDAYRARYYLGSWEDTAGLVYSEFNDKEHIVDETFEIIHPINKIMDNKQYKYRSIITIDPGYSRSKFAVNFCNILSDGTYYIYDEISRNGHNAEEFEKVSVPEIAKLIKEKIRKYGIKPMIYIDYAANAHIGGMNSITQVFKMNGVDVINCMKGNEEASIWKIKSLLKNKKIVVNPRCFETIKEFGLFSWHPKTPNKVLDENNDHMDCIKYLVNANIPATKSFEIHEYTQQDLMNKWTEELFSEKNNIKGFTNNQRTALDYGLH